MGIQHINLGGKNRPIRYSHRALRMLAGELGAKSFQDLAAKVADIGIQDIPFLTFVGLKEGARKVGEPFPETLEIVGEWLDDEDANIFEKVMDALGADMTRTSEEEEKKTPAKSKT